MYGDQTQTDMICKLFVNIQIHMTKQFKQADKNGLNFAEKLQN